MKTNMTQQSFFTEQQHLNENGIALYVDALQVDHLSKLPKEILQHVEHCEECKLQIVEVSDLIQEHVKEGIRQQPLVEGRPAKVYTIMQSYRMAAIFILAAFIGTLYFLLTQKDSHGPSKNAELFLSTDSVNVQKEPSSQKPSNDLLAESFSPSPNLDDLVQTEFRSATIEVISPENGAIVHSPISFRWSPYGKPLKIKILTNREITIQTSIVQKNTFVTTKTFSPGLYYWKLETEDELLFVGKFFVK